MMHTSHAIHKTSMDPHADISSSVETIITCISITGKYITQLARYLHVV